MQRKSDLEHGPERKGKGSRTVVIVSIVTGGVTTLTQIWGKEPMFLLPQARSRRRAVCLRLLRQDGLTLQARGVRNEILSHMQERGEGTAPEVASQTGKNVTPPPWRASSEPRGRG